MSAAARCAAPRLRRLGTVAALLSAGVVHAQTPPAVPALPSRPLQDPAQQLIDQQNARALQRQLDQPPAQIAAPNTAAALPDLPAGADIETLPEPGTTFQINDIVLDGNTVLSARETRAVLKPFIGKQLGQRRINLLIRRLTEAFVKHGWITTRAYLGEQNLKSGVLKVKVVPGKIEAFTLNGKPLAPIAQAELDASRQHPAGGGAFTDAGTLFAFPEGVGDVLSLPDIEQGVQQINRLRRNQAQVQILPGQAPGDSIIALTNQSGDSVYYSLGMDNYGSHLTGVTRNRAGIEADNLLGLQESLSLNYIDSLETNAVVGSAAVPFGRNTFSYTFSYSDYQELIGTTALLYGHTLGHILGWNYALQQSQAGSVGFDTTLSWRRTDRIVNDVALDPQRIVVLRAGVNVVRKFVLNDAPGSVVFDAGYSRGLPWLGADHDPAGTNQSDAHGQFNKLDATASVTAPLPSVFKTSWAYRGVLSGQWSNEALYSSEQLFLGGMSSIRGFMEGELAGDRGIYMRNELAWTNAPAWSGARIEPYVFFDGGKAEVLATPGWPTLAATGGGVRVQWQWHKQQLAGEVTVGRALAQPVSLGPKATLVLATFNWNY